MRWFLSLFCALAVAATGQGQSAGTYDQYGGIKSLAGTKTGWFHIEEVEGRWYFVTPEGHAFFSLGATHAVECIRLDECDPHHLILGDRLMALAERTADSILVTASKYVDVISFQPMGTRTPLRDYIDHVFEITVKPVLLADVNTMTERPQKDQVDTTAYERSAGEHTMEYYLDAAGSRYCIGLHRCTVRDYQPWNPQFHRRGLLKADDTPYPILVDYTKRTNQKVYEVVYAATTKGQK